MCYFVGTGLSENIFCLKIKDNVLSVRYCLSPDKSYHIILCMGLSENTSNILFFLLAEIFSVCWYNILFCLYAIVRKYFLSLKTIYYSFSAEFSENIFCLQIKYIILSVYPISYCQRTIFVCWYKRLFFLSANFCFVWKYNKILFCLYGIVRKYFLCAIYYSYLSYLILVKSCISHL